MAIVASGQLTLTDLNDAKQLAMYIGASQSRTVIYNGVSTYAPNYASTNQVLTPQLYIAGTATDVASQATSIRWFYQLNGNGTITEITANTTDYTLSTGAVKTLTVKSNILATRSSVTYICEATFLDGGTGFEVLSKSEIELVKVTNGTNGEKGEDGVIGVHALSLVVSNEAHVIPTDSAGNNGIYTNSGTTIRLYEGSTELTYNGTGTTNGTWKVVASGTGITAGVVAVSGIFATVSNASAMTSDTATILYSITGKRADGTSLSINRSQTFSKSKQGTAGNNGTSPTMYSMTASVDVIQKSSSNIFNPTNISFFARHQIGSGSLNNYNARWVIEDTTNNSTWTVRTVNPTTDEAVKSYTPSSTSIKAVRVKMYLTGGTTTLLDEQVIPVVSDGATGLSGADAIYAYVWNPDGNMVRNGAGTVKCHVDVYKGSVAVTGSAFKWYIQDPTATTSSGGDTDGGAGWRILNATYNAGVTNYTTDTITAPANAIQGTEAFKCVVTYNSIKYSGVTTVVDLSDPIQVRLDGMDKFKNGQGSITITASVIREGLEIDSTGTIYTYAWSIYDSSNVKTTFTKTGKTITVSATDITVKGNLVCEVSKA